MILLRRTSLWPQALLIGLLALAGCGTGPATSTIAPIESSETSPARPTLTVMSADTPAASPAATVTTKAPPATSDLRSTPTLIALPTRTGAEKACVHLAANVEFPSLGADVSVETAPPAALDYLNRGGDPAQLEAVMTRAISAKTSDGFHIQLVSAELTGDDVPEIGLALAFPVGADHSAGDTTLVVFHCTQGKYETINLFERAGAGSRSDGLYAGGGARILGVMDMNGDGKPDLVFASFWEIGSVPYAEYYVSEWNGNAFGSLIDNTDILGNDQLNIQAGWDVTIKDVDGDGKLEMVFPQAQDPASGNMVSPAVFAWDGKTYQLRP